MSELEQEAHGSISRARPSADAGTTRGTRQVPRHPRPSRRKSSRRPAGAPPRVLPDRPHVLGGQLRVPAEQILVAPALLHESHQILHQEASPLDEEFPRPDAGVDIQPLQPGRRLIRRRGLNPSGLGRPDLDPGRADLPGIPVPLPARSSCRERFLRASWPADAWSNSFRSSRRTAPQSVGDFRPPALRLRPSNGPASIIVPLVAPDKRAAECPPSLRRPLRLEVPDLTDEATGPAGRDRVAARRAAAVPDPAGAGPVGGPVDGAGLC